MARKTPQQKKRESYLKDRRSDYGEHTKSSRRSVRRHKRHMNRANRRAATQTLSQAIGEFEPEAGEGAETRLAGRRPKNWIKKPDTPLGEILQKKLRHRVKMGIVSPKAAQKKVERIRKRTR